MTDSTGQRRMAASGTSATAVPAHAGTGQAGGDELGVWSLLSIGIGGMVGGGIFAVTGLTIELTRGAAPLAFVVAGIVALFTAYSYWKLTLRYPSRGGTVEFLNRAFGTGVAAGSLSILLCLSYVILLAVYAYAFGSYGAELFGEGPPVAHLLATGVLVALAGLNLVGPHVVIRSENSMNLVKMLILGAFVAAGLLIPGDFHRLAPTAWVPVQPLIAGAMVIFLNYEGFELIANASTQARTPRRSLPVAYLGSVVLVMAVYVLIAVVVLMHMGFGAVHAHSDAVLYATAEELDDHLGGVLLIVAALVATSSAINATFYGSGRLTYLIAKYGELPAEFERNLRKQPVEGLLVFAILSILIVNLVPLAAIATMGSAGFLLVFAAVNIANVKLASQTGSSRAVAGSGALLCLLAFAALCAQTLEDAATRWQIGILVGLIVVSLAIEWVYRRISHRRIHMGHE